MGNLLDRLKRLQTSVSSYERNELNEISSPSPPINSFLSFNSYSKTAGSDDFEERAAILEFDGGLSREEAETLARASMPPPTHRSI